MEEEARKIFAGTAVNITAEGQRHLGAVVCSKETPFPRHFTSLFSLLLKEGGLGIPTGKNLRFPIYVYNMVFGCLFNVFQETRKRNNFQFQDT